MHEICSGPVLGSGCLVGRHGGYLESCDGGKVSGVPEILS